MYCDYFGFSEKPFHLTPNPRFLFLSKSHKEAFAHLLYGIDQQVGFICMTGEVGTGKTTVLRTLLEQLSEDPYRLALIFNPKLSAVELLQAICSEFGIHSDKSDLISLHDAFNAFLLRERQEGKTVVLIIDEAQNLAPEVLEQIRLLSNLETETDKLLQIVLVGQPELATILAKNELRQLRQRIVVKSTLVPLDRADTIEYIKHRLHIAGWQSGLLFDQGAITKIFEISGGLPRKINVLSDRSLLIAYGDENRMVDVPTVKQAARELEIGGRKAVVKYIGLAIGVAVMIILTGLYALTPQSIERNEDVLIEPIESIYIQPAENSEYLLLKTVLAQWGETVITPDLTINSISDSGYEVLTTVRTWEALIRLGYPAIVTILDPTTEAETSIALLKRARGQFAVALTDGSTHSISSIDLFLSRIVSTQIIWRNSERLPDYIGWRSDSETILKLQGLLSRAEGSRYSSGLYDEETIRMVKNIQRRGGIQVDGKVGPQTLLLLYRMTDSTIPQLLSKREAES